MEIPKEERGTATSVDHAFREAKNTLVALRTELGKGPGLKIEEYLTRTLDVVQEAWDFWMFSCSGREMLELENCWPGRVDGTLEDGTNEPTEPVLP